MILFTNYYFILYCITDCLYLLGTYYLHQEKNSLCYYNYNTNGEIYSFRKWAYESNIELTLVFPMHCYPLLLELIHLHKSDFTKLCHYVHHRIFAFGKHCTVSSLSRFPQLNEMLCSVGIPLAICWSTKINWWVQPGLLEVCNLIECSHNWGNTMI